MTDWFRKQPAITLGAQRLPPRPKAPWVKSTMPTELPDDKKGVSAKVVMHQFARGEVRNLNKEHDAQHAKLVAKLRTLPEFAALPSEALSEAMKNMIYRLQQSELTINFMAWGWFGAPNLTKTYTQMYERGVQTVPNASGGKSMTLKGNMLNDVNARDTADTRVMFGSNITSPSMGGVARFMDTGGLANGSGAPPGSYFIKNGQFNPKARQVFAALNYGYCPQGGAAGYGQSYLVLKNDLKTNAIYYLGDSFGSEVTAATRVTYGTVLSVMLHTVDDSVLTDFVDSLYRLVRLASTHKMIEAHIYAPVAFATDVVELRASEREIRNSRSAPPHEIVNNMKVFCNTKGIKLTMIP